MSDHAFFEPFLISFHALLEAGFTFLATFLLSFLVSLKASVKMLACSDSVADMLISSKSRSNFFTVMPYRG